MSGKLAQKSTRHRINAIAPAARLNYVSRVTRSPLACRCMCALALCLAGGGCVSSEPIEAPVGAMPIVRLPERAPAAIATREEILREARNKDVPGMVATTELIADVTERARIAAEVTTTLAPPELPLAMQYALALPPGRARGASITAVVHALAARGGTEALDWALALRDPDAALVARRAAVEELVNANPRSAIERVLALPESREREDMLGIAAAAWARKDATAAIEWVRTLPDGERKQRLTSTVAFEVAQEDPDRALQLAETLPAGRDRLLLFSAIGQTWVARDRKAALAWASHLPAGEPRDAAFAGIDTGLGIPTSRRVAAMPGVSGGARRVRGGGSAAMVALPEPNSADFEAWLATQRRGMSRDEAILEYVRQRGALQPSAVGPWLASLPGGPARDQAMQIFVDGLVISSPSEAARWITELPRASTSPEMIERTARQWLLTNPTAAEAWLRNSNLPLDRQEQLLREAGR
jgi:hypothetical protein